MRCLVIDDDAVKAQKVQAELLAGGIRAEDILVASSASDARMLLGRQSFDLMLIDVLLPARAGGKPEGSNSVELLRQIFDDGTSLAPRYVVGITASTEALRCYEEDFRRMTLHVIHVSPEVEAWREFIRNLVHFIQRANESQSAFEVDICVLDALRRPELEAVHATWPVRLAGERLLSRSILYQEGTVNLNGISRRLVSAHPSMTGPIAVAQATEVLLREFRPKVLLMTGICGGFSDHVQIGDVVVAEKSWDWQAGKWTNEGTLLSAQDQKEGSGELVAFAQSAEGRLPTFYAEFDGTRPANSPKLVVGPMVTGSSVVATIDIHKVFRQQHRKMVAVDTECYGLYYAAAASAGPPTKVLCIKAVSDLADRAKGDDFQRYCSVMSARLGLEVVQRYFTDQSLTGPRTV